MVGQPGAVFDHKVVSILASTLNFKDEENFVVTQALLLIISHD